MLQVFVIYLLISNAEYEPTTTSILIKARTYMDRSLDVTGVYDNHGFSTKLPGVPAPFSGGQRQSVAAASAASIPPG